MSAAERVLFDEPGPRARARIRIATVASVVVLLALVTLGILQFRANGQLVAAKWQYFTQWAIVRYLLQGVGMTLEAAAVSAVLAMPFGVLLALGRLSEHRALRVCAAGFVELFRSVPLLMVVYVFLLALPQSGYLLPSFWQLVLPIVLCSAPVLAEIFRAGVLALDRGQSEAAYAIGMRRGQVMRLVVLPQALRLVVPTLVSALVSLLKDTSLGYVVTYTEVLERGRVLANYSHYFVQSYIVVAVIFVVINTALSQLAHALERRARRRPRSGGAGPDRTGEITQPANALRTVL